MWFCLKEVLHVVMGDVLDLLDLLRQLACDGSTAKYIGGEYKRDVGPHLSNAYDKWQARDGPGTLEALLAVKFDRLTAVYEEKLETCKRYLRAFRKDGKCGFTVTRHEIVALTIKVQWATSAGSEEETIKTEARRDPANKYTISDGELMGELEKLVPFAHWQSLYLTAQDQTNVVYDNEEDVNFGRGTAMRRLVREQKDIFGVDPDGTRNIKLEMDLLVDVTGGENLRRVLGGRDGEPQGVAGPQGTGSKRTFSEHVHGKRGRMQTLLDALWVLRV